MQMKVHQHWKGSLTEPRYQEAKRILQYGYKVYCQNEEDGIIAEIVKRIGSSVEKTFVEFGVQEGVECNTLRLLLEGWHGLWLEGGGDFVASIQETHRLFLDRGQLTVEQAFVTKSNINELFKKHDIGANLGLLCIDVDGNDIWIWQALDVVQPAIVIIEYNATWKPPLSVAQPSNINIGWRGTNYFGASLAALVKVGKSKGYSLVGCGFAGVNAFFVRNDLLEDRFHAPYTAEEHYEPPRYWMRHLSAGHAPGIGALEQI